MSVKKSSNRKSYSKRPAIATIEIDYDLSAPLAIFMEDVARLGASVIVPILTVEGLSVRARHLSWPSHLTKQEDGELHSQLKDVCDAFGAAHPARMTKGGAQ